MRLVLKQLKDFLYYFLAVKNNDIYKDYHAYKHSHNDSRFKRLLVLAQLNIRYRICRKRGDYLFFESSSSEEEACNHILYYRSPEERPSAEEFLHQLKQYDVVSFDIFDTALLRKVNMPDGIFHIMGMEMGYYDFCSVRKNAEVRARNKKEHETGSREVSLSEIYDILEKHAGIDKRWMPREIELELNASCVNPYIHKLYQGLLDQGKTILFTSDMYLPQNVIVQLLDNAGYKRYEKIYLSNEYGVNKGNGALQRIVKADYQDRKIVHIGDSMHGDVKMTRAAGMEAIYNRSVRSYLPEKNMDCLAGSIYTAVINNTMNNGMWKDSLYYDHGYRVGGILLTGFCQYINRVARNRGVDKILFCARDCEIVHRAYNLYFHQFENDYLEVSRYALLNICSDRYAYDMMWRCIIRYMEEYRSRKTIGTILEECGYAYLIPYLEDGDLDQFMFPQAVSKIKIEEFILSHLDLIYKNNHPVREAAMEYYSSLIGDAKNILVVDIGWSGSCISIFKHFMELHFPEKNLQINGLLACTSRNERVTSMFEDEVMDSYLYSPMKNMDITNCLMPDGDISKDRDAMDRLHLPMECLFTSKSSSLLSYEKSPDGQISFVRRRMTQPNEGEIDAMQAGMLEFTQKYLDYCEDLGHEVEVPSYVAFAPFGKMLNYPLYCYSVYRNFVYDTPTTPLDTTKSVITMSALYPQKTIREYEKKSEELLPQREIFSKSGVKALEGASTQPALGRLLFVSPELTQTGTPRSLLRMCRVAQALGYKTEVWSSKDGPFRAEFEALEVPVRIVPEKSLSEASIKADISSFDMAICNTIMTDAYERACSVLIPTVWYIREATNIPDFIRANWIREYTLKNSANICCVSEYAADAIRKFTSQDIRIIPNCVEDEISMSSGYVAGSGEKVKFVQFGTMEYRKGYDVLLAAYLSLPKPYRDKAELFFAGGFINSGTAYCSYLSSKMEKEPNIHYIGVVRGEENKIRRLSQMDVVVVASRDESCSLVALEGAMLSKPLIVTENVGAKYMVGEANGFIVKTGDVNSLSQAMMKLIDRKADLARMGTSSRKMYEEYANMDAYTRNMAKLYMPAQEKRSKDVNYHIAHSKKAYSSFSILKARTADSIAKQRNRRREEEVIVSMTSHPGRIGTIIPCVKSLLSQYSKPKKLLLWLAKPQFPNMEKDLPTALLQLARNNTIFEIRWTEDDLGPHKKYYYTMQEYPDMPVITVDDDVIYDMSLVGRLMNSYRKYPDCVSSMRTNIIMFNSDGTFKNYNGWIIGSTILRDVPSAQLLPTGVGGVLYPPHAVPSFAFNKKAILDTCLFADDLWLKISTLHNGYKAVLVNESTSYKQIEGTDGTALWRRNVTLCNNDIALSRIMDYYDRTIGDAKQLRNMIWRDRAVQISTE